MCSGWKASHPRAQPGSMSSQVPPPSGKRPEEGSSRGPVGPGYRQEPSPSLQAPVGLILPTSSTSVPATPFPSACLRVVCEAPGEDGFPAGPTGEQPAFVVPSPSPGMGLCSGWTLTVVPVDSWAPPPPPQPGGCSFCLSRNLGRIHCGPLLRVLLPPPLQGAHLLPESWSAVAHSSRLTTTPLLQCHKWLGPAALSLSSWALFVSDTGSQLLCPTLPISPV